MCGIAGWFAADPERRIDAAALRAMADALRHRGPDGSGVCVRPGWGLAHRRLAIVDLADGAQPMEADGVHVTFNGEIYNFAELRRELEQQGFRFTTRCDTEVLLHGWRAWGEELPRKLRGMFAFALVDERRRTLFAARDRIGKKPFYWTQLADGDVLFASEPKALLVEGRVSRELDPVALGRFLCLRYVPDPDTIFTAIRRLRPGHAMTIADGRVRERCYWRLSFAHVADASPERLGEEVLHHLDDAVRIRLMSDVPLGAFLSGGIDSYAVVDSMARASRGAVIACTMGFEGSPLDERARAREAARACGALLHEDAIAVDDMLDQTWFAETFDEPFADASAVPTWHVSRLARRHVTVALSGDGGDESFAGYRRYKYDVAENRLRRLLPRRVWGALGALYPKLDFLPRYLRFKRTLQNLARDPAEAYARSVSAVLPEEVRPLLRPEWRAAGDDPLGPVVAAWRAADGPDALARCAAADFATWLPGDILVKVDRASMAVSLEVRAPFLDHVLVEHAATIPSALKLRGGRTKGFLRDVLTGRLGGSALQRPKQGFHVPAREWMAGRMGDALLTALSDERLDTMLDTGRVRRLLEQHRSGVRDHSELLWAVLVLHRFLKRWA